MTEDEKRASFVMYQRSPLRVRFIEAVKRRVLGETAAASWPNTKAIDYAMRFTLANWEVVAKHNPNWQQKWDDDKA